MFLCLVNLGGVGGNVGFRILMLILSFILWYMKGISINGCYSNMRSWCIIILEILVKYILILVICIMNV